MDAEILHIQALRGFMTLVYDNISDIVKSLLRCMLYFTHHFMN